MIKTQFPAFHLEDQVPLQPEGNDKPPIYFTCSRRKGTKASNPGMTSTGENILQLVGINCCLGSGMRSRKK